MVAFTDSTTQVLHVVVIYAITHAFESYVLTPLVQRRTVWLPPALSILAAVLLGLLTGFLGLLVAAPLALVIMLLVKMLYVEDFLGDRTLNVAGEARH
jgi:predicted PurR-regulated permease PerM